MTPMQDFYHQQATTIIKHLKQRNMDGYYCDNKADAVKLALSFITPGETVSFGGSMSLSDSGLLEKLKTKKNIELLDRSTAQTPDEVRSIYLKALASDTYLMSSNAITLDGHLVNIDGNGNRVAALIYGPKQVILLVGMNKVTPTLEGAQSRVQNMASPPNCVRLSRNTPCAKTGQCHDCQSEDCICSNIVITRRSHTKGRIKVILVGEVLGY